MDIWRKKLYDLYVSTGQSSPDDFHGKYRSRPNLHFEKKILRRFFPKNKDARILDLGAGTGKFMLLLQNEGYKDVHGIEFSTEQLGIGLSLGVKNLRLADLLSDDISDMGRFDVILLIDVIEHFDRKQLFSLFDKIRTIANPKCKLLLHVPNASGLFGSLARYGDLTHEIAFTPSSMRQILKCFDFDDILINEDIPIPHGALSFCRLVAWHALSLPVRLLYAAESGKFPEALSQNMIVCAQVR